MKILAIGNSFSQDATRYLHQIAKADGEELKVVNLIIGSCSLQTHYINALEDKRDYLMEFNGESTGFHVSIKEALISDNWNGSWDIITIQQVSHNSPYYETYQPYLNYIKEYIKKYSPKSKIYIHQTWAYEQGSESLCEKLKYGNYRDMLADIVSSYQKAAEDIHADGIIPSGELVDSLLQNGVSKVHRDTLHASLGLGRYALGLLWYAVLTGNDISKNTFLDFDEPISEKDIEIIKRAVGEIVG